MVKRKHPDFVSCGCGCGKIIVGVDKKNRLRRFVPGHHIKLRDFSKIDHSHLIHFEKGHIPWNKGKEFPKMAGENNPQYVDGRTKKLGPR